MSAPTLKARIDAANAQAVAWCAAHPGQCHVCEAEAELAEMTFPRKVFVCKDAGACIRRSGGLTAPGSAA